MRFLGQTEVAAFLAAHPSQTDVLRAWLAEVRHRNWPDAKSLEAEYKNVDGSKVPVVVFRFGAPAVTVETLVDFRTRTLVLGNISCEAAASRVH